MVYEYNGYSPSSSCSYNTLCGYYSNGRRAIAGGYAASSNAITQIVPVFGGVSYMSSPNPQYSGRVGSCNGYSSITSAYKNYPACASAFTTRLCSGSCN